MSLRVPTRRDVAIWHSGAEWVGKINVGLSQTLDSVAHRRAQQRIWPPRDALREGGHHLFCKELHGLFAKEVMRDKLKGYDVRSVIQL